MENKSRARRAPGRPGGNRERILTATIELMNRYGSTVGTTQLAEHLKISPGNLYYHFRNREEILAEVLARLSIDLQETLFIDPEQDTSAEQLAGYFTGGADVLWRYRFFFSASLELVINDARLSQRYREFSDNGIRAVSAIINNVVRVAPGELKLKPAERQTIAENMWVIWTSWPRFSEMRSGHEPDKADIDSGKEHLALLLKPYLKTAYFNKVVRVMRLSS